MVFDKETAPKDRASFLKWFEKQVEWSEEISYDNPADTSVALRNWFMEMIEMFPPMNGPFSNEDFDNSHQSDYTIGGDIIYVAFAWSVSEKALELSWASAIKHGVGFFDVSADNGAILFPGKNELIDISEFTKKKPWWKIL